MAVLYFSDSCAVNSVETVAGEFGRIDVLVNNAATSTHYGPALDIGEEAWDRIVEINLKGQSIGRLRSQMRTYLSGELARMDKLVKAIVG